MANDAALDLGPTTLRLRATAHAAEIIVRDPLRVVVAYDEVREKAAADAETMTTRDWIAAWRRSFDRLVEDRVVEVVRAKDTGEPLTDTVIYAMFERVYDWAVGAGKGIAGPQTSTPTPAASQPSPTSSSSAGSTAAA